MNIDLKHDLLKKHIGLNDLRADQKGSQANLPQTLVTSPEQKKLDLGLQNQSCENKDLDKKKKKAKKDQLLKNKLDSESDKNSPDYIERSPLVLLGLF